MSKFILVFDIPRENNTLKVHIWRDLQKIKARKVQHSVWKSDKMDDLIEIAGFIKKSGGSAKILEEKFIF